MRLRGRTKEARQQILKGHERKALDGTRPDILIGLQLSVAVAREPPIKFKVTQKRHDHDSLPWPTALCSSCEGCDRQPTETTRPESPCLTRTSFCKPPAPVYTTP